jgi:PAS domain S-box-containing protein
LEGSEESFYISRAVQSRVDGVWSIPVSRPIYDEQGRLLAVVVASITPEYFNQLFAGVTPNDQTMGILARADGHVLSVFPYDPKHIDESMQNSELFLDCLPACEQGLVHAKELLHGDDEHIIAYRLIEPYGLVVSFSVDKSEVLAGFYAEVAQGVALFLGVTVLVLLAAGYQARQTAALTHQSARLEGITTRLQEALTKHEAAEKSLREREELYRKLFYHAPIGIFTKDLAGRYTSSNDDMNQFAAGSVIGKTEADLQPADIAAEIWAHDQEVIQKGKHIVFEERYQTPRGLRYLLASKVPLRDADANIIGILGTTLDVTERRENAALREALIADLEARNAEMERFTYTVSHDLRSPLVTVEGFLGMLEKDALAGDVEKVREDMAFIRSATGKMGELLRELLALSRVGRLTNEPVQVSMRELAEEAVALLAGPIGGKRISVDIAPDLPIVLGDRVRLVEVLQNLLSNAIKYSQPDGQAHIAIGHRQMDGDTVFFVRDDGIGIAPEFQEKVFELFAKLNPASEGTGIGLALVRRIVEVHGGRIWVESAGVGQGTTFYFTLAGDEPPADTVAQTSVLEKGGEA